MFTRVLFLAALGIGAPGPLHAAVCGGGTTACGDATGVTYNGSALTFAGAATNGTVRTEIWYLKAPASGAHNVVVTAPFATDVTASSISFTGVNQTTPLGTLVTNIGTGTTASVTANTIIGEPVVDVMGAVGTTTPTISGTTQTSRNTNNTSTGIGRVVSGNSTAFGQAAPVTMSWTVSSADWAIAAVPIKASTPLTGLEVGSFTATWGDGATLLQWRSGYQPTTVGFYVHRREGNGPRTRLNAELIQGGALSGTLASYSWTDATPGWNGPVSYWLEEVTQNGSNKWYGPASPVPPPVEPPAPTQTAKPDGSADAFTPVGGFTGGGGGTGGAVAGLEAQGGCIIGSRAPNLDAARMLVLLGVGLSSRRRGRRRGWVLPALLVALLLATSFVGTPDAGAAGGVTVDATATATGASGLTFSHTMGAGSNGLLVVTVVMPISCVDTTNDSGSCAACGTTCSLDTSTLSSGLIGLWHFDEGSGATSADSSGTGSTAVLSGSPAWTTGYSQKALQFNGATTQYAQASLTSHFGANNPLTAAVWVYATANTNGPLFGVTAQPSGNGWNMPFLSINGATVYGYVWNNTIMSSTVSLNAWHLVALTYDNASSPSTRLYVDGAQVATTTGTYSPSGFVDYWSTVITGAKPGGVNSNLLGRIDEVRAYNRVLSAGELSTLYTARLGCATSTCAACGGGKTSCSGNCVVTATDNNNCGGCGIVCNTAGGETCSGGTCVCSNMALTDCSTFCVDTTANPSNCGTCGTVCGNDTPTFVNTGLLARWKMDEGTGTTTADASGNGRTATFSGSPSWTAGYSGTALSFNGASYAQANIGTWFGGNNPLTASGWVYATATTNGPIFGVTSLPSGGGWNMPFLSIVGATVYGHIWMVNGNTPLSSTVTLNAWHHLAITYEPGVGEKFYVDGAQVASATGTFQASGLVDYWSTHIPGTKPSGVNSDLTGIIDDVRAYSRVLSASEIAIVYNSRQSCASSMCGGCGGGLSVCSGSCTNTTIDPNNCGGCGTTCNAAGGETCIASSCGCATGTDCSSVCVDTTTDNNNCGGCAIPCGTTTCASCAQSMLGFWHLDEGSGTTSADASGNSRNATLTGGVTWTTGYSSNAVAFNGTTGRYLTAPLGTWFGGNNALSASAWVYATSTTNGPVFGVTNVAGAGSWDMPFLSINGATVYGWLWQVNGNTPLSATVTLNAWHHLVVTYEPGVGEKFYVDGALSGSGTGTFSSAGATVFWTTYIPGATPSGVNNSFNGKLDEVRAFKRVLTAGEVRLLYDNRQSCVGSSCGGCPTGTTSCSGTCTNTQADPANCGAGCAGAGGVVCSGGTPYCVAGACSATP